MNLLVFLSLENPMNNLTKIWLILACLFTLLLPAQNYVDVFRIGLGESFNNEFEGTDAETSVTNFDLNLTYPIQFNEQTAMITGIDLVSSRLRLIPNGTKTTLYSTTLQLGVNHTFNDKWSGALIALPKLASDYHRLQWDDLLFGGYVVARLKKSENFTYRFGWYLSDEQFGIFTAPIFGWYYLSPNSRFEMDVSLPVSVDISYGLGAFSVGMDYFGIGRSFNINEVNRGDVYVQQVALDFAAYLQWNGFDKSVLIRGKVGYTNNDFELYADGDNYDIGITALRIGDDRIRLNPEISGGIFAKVEAIYRFNLSNSPDNEIED